MLVELNEEFISWVTCLAEETGRTLPEEIEYLANLGRKTLRLKALDELANLSQEIGLYDKKC